MKKVIKNNEKFIFTIESDEEIEEELELENDNMEEILDDLEFKFNPNNIPVEPKKEDKLYQNDIFSVPIQVKDSDTEDSDFDKVQNEENDEQEENDQQNNDENDGQEENDEQNNEENDEQEEDEQNNDEEENEQVENDSKEIQEFEENSDDDLAKDDFDKQFFSLPKASTPSKTFSEMKLSRIILKAISEMGFVTPTKIQEQAIPILLNGLDVCASAVTGSGKTAAFMLPILGIFIF